MIADVHRQTMDACAVYRLITSPFIHGGVLHIALNMMTLVPIGSSLERNQGTLGLANVITLLILGGGLAYLLLALAAGYIPWR